MVADYQSVVFKHQALLDIWTVALLRVCIVLMRSGTARITLFARSERHTSRLRTRIDSLVMSLAGLAIGVVD